MVGRKALSILVKNLFNAGMAQQIEPLKCKFSMVHQENLWNLDYSKTKRVLKHAII